MLLFDPTPDEAFVVPLDEARDYDAQRCEGAHRLVPSGAKVIKKAMPDCASHPPKPVAFGGVCRQVRQCIDL